MKSRSIMTSLRSQWRVLAKRRVLVVLVLVMATLGLVLTLTSQAATFSTAFEAETGSLSGNQSAGSTNGASANASVKFGSTDSNPGAGAGPAGGDGPADASNCTRTAADYWGWGEPQYQSNFNTPTLDPTWHPYGPEPGHNKRGERTPTQITMGDGNVTLNADGKGKTAAMKWFPGQRYGRWEVCMKVKTGQQHYVLLTWPDAEDWPQGGEIDFMEESGGPTKQTFFLHCPTSGGGNCATGSTNTDAREWTAFAVEWLPNGTTVGYVNGEQFFKSTNPAYSAPRPMNLCIQLDYFGNNTESDAMVVDWAKQWPVQGSQPSVLGLKPGEPATGQPGDYPNRAPRAMSVSEMRP